MFGALGFRVLSGVGFRGFEGLELRACRVWGFMRMRVWRDSPKPLELRNMPEIRKS